jgi:hypothetical protein
MRDRYSWYLPPTSEELDYIWNNGVLTVDTNVLLDLYRMTPDHRETLLSAIFNWKGHLHLTA